MIIDADTFAFLMTVSSNLRYAVAAAFLVGVPTLVLLWQLDPFRVRLHAASIGGGSCLVGLACLSLAIPIAPHSAFYSDDYVSNFVQSGVAAISELMTHGFMESDAATTDRLEPTIGVTAIVTAAPCAEDDDRQNGEGTKIGLPAFRRRSFDSRYLEVGNGQSFVCRRGGLSRHGSNQRAGTRIPLPRSRQRSRLRASRHPRMVQWASWVLWLWRLPASLC
jgi:hypothetical protein